MFEKVNPSHPDKVADRIAVAIVYLCYTKSKSPKVACDVLIGHGDIFIQFRRTRIARIVYGLLFTVYRLSRIKEFEN